MEESYWEDNWYAKGIAALAQEQLGEAVDCLRQAIDQQPFDARAHGKLGYALWQKGAKKDGLESLTRGLELDPNDRALLMDCAKVFAEAGRKEDAVDILESYLERNPWDKDMAAWLEQFRLEERPNLGCQVPDPARFFVEQGEQQYAKGQVERAKICFEMALEKDPNSSRACNNLGVLHWQNGQLEEGLNWLYKALDLDGKDGEILRNSSLALAEAGECDTAADLLELFLQQHPDDDQAWTDYRELIKQSASVWHAEGLNGAAGEVYLKTAAALLDVQDRQGAIEALGRAAILRPDDAEPLYQLALMHLDLDQKDDAIGMLRAGLERDPEHRGVVLALARTLIEEGVPEHAQPVLEGYLAGHEDQEVASCLDQAKASDEQQQCA